MEADPRAQAVGGEVERRWHSVTGSGGECAGEVCLDLVKLFGGSSCTDSARMKEFTARVSTAAFAAAASGVPSELRATCMGKSGV